MNEKVYSLWAGGPERTHAGLFTVQECVANFALIIRQFGVVVRRQDEKELLPIDTDFDHFAWVVLVLWKEKQEERLGTMYLLDTDEHSKYNGIHLSCHVLLFNGLCVEINRADKHWEVFHC